MAGADALLAVVIAPRCVVCDALLDRPSGGPVCPACWQSIPLAPARPSTLASPPACRSHVTDYSAIGVYDGVLRTIVHALKYGKHRSLAGPVGRALARHGETVLEGADACVPVPLYWTRAWRRGFNQAALIARELGPPIWPALRRVRATRPQIELPADERHRNVREAFAVAGRWQHALRGKRIVLVDDVATTGSTLAACAVALRRAGVREVRALTAARVPDPR